jgi:hypothetical protein
MQRVSGRRTSTSTLTADSATVSLSWVLLPTSQNRTLDGLRVPALLGVALVSGPFLTGAVGTDGTAAASTWSPRTSGWTCRHDRAE